MDSVQKDVGRQTMIIVIAGIAVVAIAGYVVWTWYSSDTSTPSRITELQTTGKGTDTPENEHYAHVLDRYNRQNASAAQNDGKSWLSVMSSRSQNVPEQVASRPQALPASTPVQAALPQQQPLQQAQVQGSQANTQQDAQHAGEVADQTRGLLANWKPEPHGLARVATDGLDAQKTGTSNMAGATRTGTGNAVTATKVKVVEDFALVPALLQTDIDTDENSMVTASVPGGPYAGALLYAMGYKRLTNTVDMTFTYMKWQGHAYKVTAKAEDPVSSRTALSGEVNNRYFSRIILPAIAMGIGRTGQLYEQANAQNIVTPDGGVIQTYPATPSATAVAGTIVGGIANQAGQVLANDAANMSVKQVLIAKGTTIGIQFIGPVLDSDDVALGATTASESKPQESDTLSVLAQPSAQPARANGATGSQGNASQAPSLQGYQARPVINYSTRN